MLWLVLASHVHATIFPMGRSPLVTKNPLVKNITDKNLVNHGELSYKPMCWMLSQRVTTGETIQVSCDNALVRSRIYE